MNYTIVKIATKEVTDDEECPQYPHTPSHFVKTEAFTVLPPLSPQIPGPPPTPSPYRILPPIVSRKRPSFVIIQELGSRPQSREPSPSGRVSPFRGCGFKPSPTSREHSPSRQNDDSPQDETGDSDKTRESRSRLPVASKKTPTRKVSKSVSPARPKSGIPVPLSRRISCSPTSKINQKSPLKSSENLLGRRPAVSESDLKSALRRSNTNVKQLPPSGGTPRKLPVPRQTKTVAKSGTLKSKTASGDIKKTTPTASPPRRNLYLGRNEALKKTGEGGGKDSLVKSSPTRPKTLPKTSSKIVSAKSKENLSPCSNPPIPMKVVKSPSKITKTSSRPPAKTRKTDAANPTALGKVEETVAAKPEDCKVQNNSDGATDTATITATSTDIAEPPIPAASATTIASSATEDTNSTTSTIETIVSTQSNEVEKSSKPLKAMMKRVGRKALTTGNLMAALRKSASEAKNKTETSTREEKTDERKELPHMDTSRSLPISIVTANLTESSVTLIRTTTEPALAPVQPELISEIRSALVDVRAAEEAMSTQKELSEVASGVASEAAANINSAAINGISEMKTTANAATINSSPEKKTATITNITTISNPLDMKKCKGEVVEEVVCQVESVRLMAQPKKETQSKGSPHPVHVVAVTKIEEPKQEMTSTIVEIKQEADSEVQSVNASNRSENRNGMSKSSWLNERPQTDMKKLSIRKLKENPSTESLMSNTSKASRWHRFKSKCPKCFRRAPGTHPVDISTITKSAADAANVAADPKTASFIRKYLICVRCQCKKSSKAKRSSTDLPKRSFKPQWRCFKLKHGFENVFDKVTFCKRNKKVSSKFSTPSPVEDTEVACIGPLSEDSKPGLCGRCSGKVFKCLGILCCVNSAFCVSMRSKCGRWCSCCRKCVCCGERKKKVISEAEHRRSTISVQPKKKWTRYFTDFPKLDTSFVEHGSIMRAAIPVLPVPLAWICLILNVFLPGFGTLSSGIFCLFVGKPRFSINDSILSRIGSFMVNLLVASSQLFTVLFCLVGWGWSVWWGVMMVKMAKKNKRIILAEQGSGATHLSPVAAKNRDPEKGAASNG